MVSRHPLAATKAKATLSCNSANSSINILGKIFVASLRFNASFPLVTLGTIELPGDGAAIVFGVV